MEEVEIEKLFALIAFNYVFGNGDAHLEEFFAAANILWRFRAESRLRPCLCTSLHLPNESRTALDLFDDFTTPSFAANAFAKRADFLELAERFTVQRARAEAILTRFATNRAKIHALLERSFLSRAAKDRFFAIVADRLMAIAD